jgi:hypothetical protein
MWEKEGVRSTFRYKENCISALNGLSELEQESREDEDMPFAIGRHGRRRTRSGIC